MSSAAEKSALLIVKWPLATLLVALAAGAALITGSYLYLQHEQGMDQVSQRGLLDAQAKLGNANKEIEELRTSVDTYKKILALNAFKPENRLQWIETVDALKRKRRLIGLDYEIAPQLLVGFTAGNSYTSIDILGSRVQMKVLAYHEGDFISFLDDLAELQNGFLPADSCLLRVLPTPTDRLGANIQGECTFDWVTLKDKRAPEQPAATVAKS